MDYLSGLYYEDHEAPPWSPLIYLETNTSNSSDTSVPLVVVATKKKSKMTRWPLMRTLFC